MQKNKGRAAVPPGRIERRLTAILAADVASYSRLMGADEEDTLTRFKSHRHELVDPTIGDHGGRIVKSTGDGLLVEFASAVDAVRCAVEIQIRMVERNANVPPEKRIQFRIGVNAGDVMIDGDDIFGDDVNIAARLEGVAEPGGICVSGSVQEGVAGKVDHVFDDRSPSTEEYRQAGACLSGPLRRRRGDAGRFGRAGTSRQAVHRNPAIFEHER
jgi:adenylate cyclase